MRVLALTNLYPNPLQPHRAPFNRHQFRLLNERCPVRVIVPIAWTDRLRRGRCPRRTTLDGLTIEHPLYWFPPKISRGSYGEWFRLSVRSTFRRAVREFQPTIIFSPWVYPDGWAAVRLGHAAKLPVVVQAHGSDIRLLDAHPARQRPTAEALRDADGIVAVSRDLADRIVTLGAASANVRVIYDGVDDALFHPGDKAAARAELGLPHHARILLYVGNLVAVKSVNILIDAMKELDALLFVIGEGPQRAALEAQAAGRGLRDRVSFRGSLPLEQLPAWYRAADVFVLPSLSEGVPNVLLEASACGTPWVASAVGGIPEITDRGPSRLVAPGDSARLAAAIRDMLHNPPAEPRGTTHLRTRAVAELHAFLEEIQMHYPRRLIP